MSWKASAGGGGSSGDTSLPYSVKDVHYDNAKFRHRPFFQVASLGFVSITGKRNCLSCGIGKFLLLLFVAGLVAIMVTHRSSIQSAPNIESHNAVGDQDIKHKGNRDKFHRVRRKPPQLPPRLPPGYIHNHSVVPSPDMLHYVSKWSSRQQQVRKAFIHAWSGYHRYAMGSDELMPLSQRGVDGLGGLGATIVDSLDTALIMGINEIAVEAGTWIEQHLQERIAQKGQVNLFETTIRVLGGLLSAHHLSLGENSGPKPDSYLEAAKKLGDCLLSAFTSSPTPIPFSDVVLHDCSAHPAPDGLSSTSEVATVQLEFNYLSQISGDPKYSSAAMKVFEHIKGLPKVQGLVPIYMSPQSGQFNGENIRLGSRGDSYYEYLLKVWLQQKNKQNSQLKYMHDMYEEAIKGVNHLLVRKSSPKGLVFVGELPYGSEGTFHPKMDHLVCFLPGTLALGVTNGFTKKKALKEKILTSEGLKTLNLAEDLAKTCFEIYAVTSTGLAPEIVYFNTEGYSEGYDGGNKSSEYINDIVIKPADRHNLLRPETVESLFILYRITEDPKYREWGWRIFEAFEKHSKVDSGGYSSLDDVTTVPPHKRDKMETFFLGETLKYLYLLFGEDDVLPLDKFVFNTEAHPIPVNGIGT